MKTFSILEEDNSQIYTHLDNVLVHMIDKQETAIFKLKQDFNKNKEKISQYIKYAENWQVVSVICSYASMACDVLLIVAMIIFLLKYCKIMQVMLVHSFSTDEHLKYWHTVSSSRSDRQNLSTVIHFKFTKRGRDYR